MDFAGQLLADAISAHMPLICMEYENPFEDGFTSLVDDSPSFEAYEASIEIRTAAADTRNPFDDVPDEILSHILKFLDPSLLFFVADVCKRFRAAACQEIRSFSMDMYPGPVIAAEPGVTLFKKLEFAGRLIVRFQNLRSLDLSDPSCGSFLDSSFRITSFAKSLADGCRKIESFTLVGVRGTALLSRYARSLGPDAKVTHVSLDIRQAAIGCANNLIKACKHLNLRILTLGTSYTIRRCSRTTDVLSQLFRQLLPGVKLLKLQLLDSDEDIVSLAVREASDLKHFTSGRISGSSLVTLGNACAGIESLKICAGAESLKQLHHFPRLCRLWINVHGHAGSDAEELERSFRAEPLCSQLRLLVVRGYLSSDPLLGIGRLSGLETLILDHCNRFLYYKMDHSYKAMRNLKNIIIVNSFRNSIAASAPDTGTERTSADFFKLFPALRRIQFSDWDFHIHGNKLRCEPAKYAADDWDFLFKV